jgi:hypothetical protein
MRHPKRGAALSVERLEDRLTPTAQTIGVFDPSTGGWYLRNEDSPGAPDAGQFQFGLPGWEGVTGDWNGDGVTTVGSVDPTGTVNGNPTQFAIWYLRNENSAGGPDVTPFAFGLSGWIPVTGDWTGSGHTGIGMYDPATATWYLENDPGSGKVDFQFQFGAPNWAPVTGDWNGDGVTTIGVVAPLEPSGASGPHWYLRNENDAGAPDAGSFSYGFPGWTPVTGDWSGSGITGIGMVDPQANWYLRDTPSAGSPDITPFAFGSGLWKPVSGAWTGGSVTNLVIANLPAAGTEGVAVGPLTGLATFTVSGGAPIEPTSNFSALVTWGDGSHDVGTVVPLGNGNYRVDAPAHIYAEEGPYQVQVTVVHNQTAQVSSPAQGIHVNDFVPHVTAAGAPTTLAFGGTFSGAASFADPGQDSSWILAVSYDDFTNGNQTTSATPGQVTSLSHTYYRSGQLQLTATVTDDEGVSGSALIPMTVLAPAVVYVNPLWAGTFNGIDPDGAGPAHTFGPGGDAFATIADALSAVADGGVIEVEPGTYNESATLGRGVTLQAFGASGFTLAGDLTAGAGTAFDLNGKLVSAGALAGAGTVTLNGGMLTTGSDGESTTFAGGLNGPGTLVKTGAGPFTLAGIASPGAVSVQGGSLLVSGTLNAGSVQLAVAGVLLGGAGMVNGPITVQVSNAQTPTQVQGITVTVPAGGTGISLVAGATNVSIVGVTVTGDAAASTGVLVPAGASAVLQGDKIQHNHLGLDVNGGTALVQGTDLSYDAAGSGAAGLRAEGGAVVDAGQLSGAPYGNITGLGVSAGGNTFLGYTTAWVGAGAPADPAVAPQAIRDLNTGGAYANSGPQGNAFDLPAQGNNFGVGTLKDIENLLYHDLENAALGFVNYATNSAAPPHLLGSIQYSASVSSALSTVQQGLGDLSHPGQKSIIRYLIFTFDSFVVLAPGAIDLEKLNGPGAGGQNGAVSLVLFGTAYDPATGHYTLTFSFNGPLTEFGSLSDGNYQLHLEAGQVQGGGLGGLGLDTNANGIGGEAADNVVESFWRLYGDVFGDRQVDETDHAAFLAAYRSRVGMTNYRAYLDFTGDGLIDNTDYYQFMRHFRMRLNPDGSVIRI